MPNNNHSDFSWFVFLCIGIYLFCILPTASLWYDIFTMADAQRHIHVLEEFSYVELALMCAIQHLFCLWLLRNFPLLCF